MFNFVLSVCLHSHSYWVMYIAIVLCVCLVTIPFLVCVMIRLFPQHNEQQELGMCEFVCHVKGANVATKNKLVNSNMAGITFCADVEIISIWPELIKLFGCPKRGRTLLPLLGCWFASCHCTNLCVVLCKIISRLLKPTGIIWCLVIIQIWLVVCCWSACKDKRRTFCQCLLCTKVKESVLQMLHLIVLTCICVKYYVQ